MTEAQQQAIALIEKDEDFAAWIVLTAGLFDRDDSEVEVMKDDKGEAVEIVLAAPIIEPEPIPEPMADAAEPPALPEGAKVSKLGVTKVRTLAQIKANRAKRRAARA